jgi:hypothetical protein
MSLGGGGRGCRGQDVAACAIHDRAMSYCWTYHAGAAWKMDLLVWAQSSLWLLSFYSGTASRVAERLSVSWGPHCAGIAFSVTLIFSGVIALMEGR